MLDSHLKTNKQYSSLELKTIPAFCKMEVD